MYLGEIKKHCNKWQLKNTIFALHYQRQIHYIKYHFYIIYKLNSLRPHILCVVAANSILDVQKAIVYLIIIIVFTISSCMYSLRLSSY